MELELKAVPSVMPDKVPNYYLITGVVLLIILFIFFIRLHFLKKAKKDKKIFFSIYFIILAIILSFVIFVRNKFGYKFPILPDQISGAYMWVDETENVMSILFAIIGILVLIEIILDVIKNRKKKEDVYK